MRLSILTSTVVAVLVGFCGTLAIVVAAAQRMGADAAQTSSWVAAICLAIAISSAFLSLRHRMPIVAAWSTPGAALIAAATPGIGMNAAVGAFLLAGALVVLTAAFRPIGVLIQRIPTPIAAAMLAGILIRFAIGLFDGARAAPEFVLPLVGLFLLVRLASPPFAVLAVLAGGIALAFATGLTGALPLGGTISTVTLITPSFEPAVLIGLGLPLFLVTMASQNLPGFAVLRAAGYTPPTRSILAVTGLVSLATAPFGAHTSNLAAITAALCTGPDAHPDPAKRWMTGPFYGLGYVLLAVFGASLVGLMAAMPPVLIATVAGTALIGPLAGALGTALAPEPTRVAATLTLAISASGLALFGIGAAFWGLMGGLLVIGLDAAMRQIKSA